MDGFIKLLLAAARKSEFWVAVWQTFIEVSNMPPPEVPGLEGSAFLVKVFSWCYVGFRVLSTAVKFILPNPSNPAGGWFKADTKAAALLLGALLVAAPVSAQDAMRASVLKLNLGVNGTWYDGVEALPEGAEVGITVPASLSPHIGVQGSAWFGRAGDLDYWRADIGPQVVMTDVNNPEFSVSVGIKYNVSTEESVRPEEWGPDVTMGWRPWYARYPRLTVGIGGGYGLKSNQANARVALRWRVAPKPGS